MELQVQSDKISSALRYFGPEAIEGSCDLEVIARALGFSLSVPVGFLQNDPETRVNIAAERANAYSLWIAKLHSKKITEAEYGQKSIMEALVKRAGVTCIAATNIDMSQVEGDLDSKKLLAAAIANELVEQTLRGHTVPEGVDRALAALLQERFLGRQGS